MLIVDVHCHLHEYDDSEISDRIAKLGIRVIAVSDDLPSSQRTLELAKAHSWVYPALGLHPWSVDSESVAMVREIVELIVNNRDVVRFVGEVGLDKRFKAETLALQKQVFLEFLDVAREYQLGVSVHSVDTWREVLDLLSKYDIPVAVFHWYTGPVELLKEIKDRGYFISINPAIKIQEKHRRIAMTAPLDIVLFESDGPYNYRGFRLDPSLIMDTIVEVARLRQMTVDEILQVVYSNEVRLFKAVGISLE